MTGTTPDRSPLDATRISDGFAVAPDLRLELLAEAPSSNAVAAERARAGAAEGLVVVADHQSAGRGRLDRTWETPAGTAVTFSLLLRPTVAPTAWPWLPLLVGARVTDALRALGHDARVKWPNDVLLGDDRKVAGILVERVETPQGPAAVVGVGINVTQEAEDLPVETATSLALSDPAAADRTRVLVDAVTAVLAGYRAWQDGGDASAEALAAQYRERSATIGREVRVELPGGGRLVGRASDVDAHGRLVVETPEGTERVGAGDVVHVRPA